MKIVSLIMALAMMVLISCKKEPTNKFCFQLVDPLGNDLNSVCDKTDAEMQAAYPNSCNYYKTGEKFCWLIDSNIFIANQPEGYVQHYMHCYGNFSNYRKVACDYCQKWFTRQKSVYKPNNNFTYSPVQVKTYCGDTLQTLVQGREIILRETTDSLITIQFSNNGVF